MGSNSKLIILLFIIVSFNIFSSETEKKTDDKIFSQKEFDEKVKTTIDRQIDMIKKKSISELAKELSDKSLKLENKEEELQKREELIAIQNRDFLEKVSKFEVMKSSIIGCIENNENQKNSRINKVVEVISNMKPVKAAEILAVQDSDISINILSKLEAAKASKIFNLMDKEISARLQKQYLDMKR